MSDTAHCFAPSEMRHVLGALDPAALVQINFDLIASHWGLSLQAVNGVGLDLEADDAATIVQANFDAIATAQSLTLYPVATAADPEVCAEMNFWIINDNW